MCDVCLTSGAAGFPERLRTIPDAPRALWIRGRPDALPVPGHPALAIVGSRTATRDGLDLARHLAFGLAGAGVTVVSGLARGIDGAAHRATLDAGGRTVAVLGSRLSRLYPREHAGLAADIAQQGAVVSECPPDTAPHAGLFPRRTA
ncbi:MAG: DNA-processing protein DprA [Vicinamibacterales bacterium]